MFRRAVYPSLQQIRVSWMLPVGAPTTISSKFRATVGGMSHLKLERTSR
jgi:hypothetical protein